MPEKEEQQTKHRMVVEEIEIPEKTTKVEGKEPEPVPEHKPDILDEGIKVSSQELIDKPTNNRPLPSSKQGSPIFWILIPGVLILGAILGGIVFYEKGVNIKLSEGPTPTPSISTSTTPTPTPSATPDISNLEIAVLNGSGISGEAAKAKQILDTAGFNVVSTGNAASYDYTKTIIKAKSTVDSSVIQRIKDTLSKSYVMGDNQTLATTSTTDIQIIVGSSKAE
jgi:hypothetical protein